MRKKIFPVTISFIFLIFGQACCKKHELKLQEINLFEQLNSGNIAEIARLIEVGTNVNVKNQHGENRRNQAIDGVKHGYGENRGVGQRGIGVIDQQGEKVVDRMQTEGEFHPSIFDGDEGGEKPEGKIKEREQDRVHGHFRVSKVWQGEDQARDET